VRHWKALDEFVRKLKEGFGLQWELVEHNSFGLHWHWKASRHRGSLLTTGSEVAERALTI
jgi:hypothetical protein